MARRTLERLGNIFSKLKMNATLSTYTPVDNDDLFIYDIAFEYAKDIKYLAFYILENPIVKNKQYTELSKVLEDILDTEDDGTNKVIELMLTHDLLELFITITEQLYDRGIINEWQGSNKAIKKYSDFVKQARVPHVPWIVKYHAIRHMEIWYNTVMEDIVNKFNDNLEYLDITADVLYSPLTDPYMIHIMIPDVSIAITFLKHVHRSEKFKTLRQDFVAKMEDAICLKRVRSGCIQVVLDSDNFKIFADIVQDLCNNKVVIKR
jgi:hypothetical protein